jgi:hypothetical protein
MNLWASEDELPRIEHMRRVLDYHRKLAKQERGRGAECTCQFCVHIDEWFEGRKL